MSKVKLLVMDVDGTLTDGRIYIGPGGEVMKAFDAKDGYGIAHLREHDVEPVILTGRESGIVAFRADELGIREVRQGVSDKVGELRAVAEKYGAAPEEIAYIGDDLNDMDCIRFAGISAAPADAAEPVRQAADYVCRCGGGRGAVREFIELLAARNAGPEGTE